MPREKRGSDIATLYHRIFAQTRGKGICRPFLPNIFSFHFRRLKRPKLAPLYLRNLPSKQLLKSCISASIIFDSSLNYRTNKKMVTERCSNRINLLHLGTGTSEGTFTHCVLILYRTLVRSFMEYACEDYPFSPMYIKS